MIKIHIVLPSLKISGGAIEALRLGGDISVGMDCEVDALCLWQSPHPLRDHNITVSSLSNWVTRLSLAPLQLPIIAVRFFLRLNREKHCSPDVPVLWVFTHYSTLPLSLFASNRKCLFFVQGLEWTFMPWRWSSKMLKGFIFFIYRRGTVVTANDYLTHQLELHGIDVSAVAPIWADQQYRVQAFEGRDIDVVMVIRKGSPKRPDLYCGIIPLLRKKINSITIAVITPEDEIADMVGEMVDVCLLRPKPTAMAAIYARSRVFLFLSENEGFGLPPLEAMGAGCVPLCRDCGGVRAYMTGPLKSLLIPLEHDLEEISDRVQSLLADNSLNSELTDFSRLAFEKGLERSRNRVKDLVALIEVNKN